MSKSKGLVSRLELLYLFAMRVSSMLKKLGQDMGRLRAPEMLLDCLPIDAYFIRYERDYRSYYALVKARRDFLKEKYGLNIGLKSQPDQWERLKEAIGGREAALLCIREGYLSGKIEEKIKEWEEWGYKALVRFVTRYRDLALSTETERLLEERLGRATGEKGRQRIKTAVEERKHSELIGRLVEIGKALDYRVRTEYSDPSGQFRYDVVWFKGPEEIPGRIFEVHIHGDIIHALARLKHANDIWRPVRLCIVLGTERDKERIQRLAQGTFHEIAEKLVVLSAKDLEVSTEALKTFL